MGAKLIYPPYPNFRLREGPLGKEGTEKEGTSEAGRGAEDRESEGVSGNSHGQRLLTLRKGAWKTSSSVLVLLGEARLKESRV